ncbi:MAG: hypothetical protein ACLUI3_11295 [Christensenellales bacterium]
MKKWMILAAAILVVLGIGFAVKGASDKNQGATPEETGRAGDDDERAERSDETANALREETETTETEDGAEKLTRSAANYGDQRRISDSGRHAAGHGAGQHLRRHALQRFAPAGRGWPSASMPR